MKLPDGVILDETIPDQVRFNRVIIVGITVLATLTRTDGEFTLHTQTMPSRNGNKLCHMIHVSWIQPRCLVHPFPVHDREHLAHTNNEIGAYKQQYGKKTAG